MAVIYDAGWDLQSSDRYKAMALRRLIANSSDDLYMIACCTSSATAALSIMRRNIGSLNVAKEIGIPQRVIEEVLGELISGLKSSPTYYRVLMECIFCTALLRNGELLDNIADHGPFLLKEAAQKIRKENDEAIRIRSSNSGISDSVREPGGTGDAGLRLYYE